MLNVFCFKLQEKRKQCPCKPGSVPYRNKAPVIYLVRRLPYVSSVLPSIAADASDGQSSDDGIRELAAPRWNSLTITRQLVVSYTTFSPLPIHQEEAVIFFFHILLLPIAGTFTSGASYAARTFLSCPS